VTITVTLGSKRGPVRDRRLPKKKPQERGRTGKRVGPNFQKKRKKKLKARFSTLGRNREKELKKNEPVGHCQRQKTNPWGKSTVAPVKNPSKKNRGKSKGAAKRRSEKKEENP